MVKKIIENIRKKDIDIYFMVVLLVVMLSFKQQISGTDGLWNFSNIYKMSIGYRIYKDINVIITPLFFYIGKILLNILGQNFRTFVFYNFMIYTVFFGCINVIFKELKINKSKRITFILILFFIFREMLSIGANYNILAFIPILVSIILFLKKKENYLIHAILVFITTMCKQNIGVFHGIGIVLYIIVQDDKKAENKIINIIKIGIVNIALFMVFCFAYKSMGLLDDFIDMAFLGIGEFSKSNTFFNYYESLYFYLAILIDIFLVYAVTSKKLNFEKNNVEIKNNIKTLICFGTPMIFIGIPIVNSFHSILSCLIVSMGFLYTIENMILNDIKIKRAYLVNVIIILLLISRTAYDIIKSNEYIYTDKKSPYYGGYILKEDKEKIENICEFIIENNNNKVNVIVLSKDANMFMTPLKKANREFDLPFLGNLGKKGEDGLIEKIKCLNNTKILIRKDEEKTFWQESKKVEKYVKENYINIGEIEEYNIFYIR